MMARIEIADFDITPTTQAKFWSHDIDEAQVYAVLDHFWTVIRNRKRRAAPFILLGTDDQGTCLAIPIVPTDDPHIWRPITAWPCKPGEATKLRQARRIMEEAIAYDPRQEPLDDEERELMDPDNWDWDHPIEGRTVGTPGAVLRIRLSREEFIALSRRARAAGFTAHEFIKQAALEAMHAPRPSP